VVRPVVALRLEVDEREAGEHAARRRLLHAAVDGGDVLRRDHAADDRVLEQVPLAARQRRHADPRVAELALAARLLLVPPLRLRGGGDGLAVGDGGPRELGLHAVLAPEPRELQLEVPLPHAAHHGLVRLGVVGHGERGVLVVQPVQPRLQLVLGLAGRGVRGEVHHRLGELELRQPHRVLARRERVVGVRVAQLGHAPHVAGPEPRHLHPVAA
jgi:hypothetical protein